MLWACIFGAVCPERGATAALVMPHADMAAMNAHLAESTRTIAVIVGKTFHRIVLPTNLLQLQRVAVV